MAEIKFEITKKIEILSENSTNGWKKEFNMVSWNNGEPKYDIRSWSKDGSKMSKGITLTEDEVVMLKEALNNIDL